ncbi:Holliday junction resolvase RuvX [bacterium]|nr:Holliday junction resolvase RuvX [bacterium]MBU1025796.1 Holliday junction resolvase RuvX [bacterium]
MKALGLDIGDKKIGYAIADTDLRIAIPKGVFDIGTRDEKIQKIFQFVQDENIELIVVGMPYNLKGEIGHQAHKVELFLKYMKREISLPLEIIDERLSSKIAGGGDDDAVAAAIILQTYLDRNYPVTGEDL